MRILVADDNRDLTESLAVLLRAWDFEPVVVNDGLDAMDVLEGPFPPALALVDWMMPGVSGDEICRQVRLRTDRAYTYIVMMTARGSRDEMLEGLDAGADEYLVKPADPRELRARLKAGRRIVELQNQLLITQDLLRERATRDSLTGLWNRGTVLEILRSEIERARREGTPVAVVMADIDRFKSVNDTLGHHAGDEVLREAGRRFVHTLRGYDAVARYGGEEFLIVLPGCDAAHSLALAERLRHGLDCEAVACGGCAISVTASLGVAVWDGASSQEDLLRAADEALYRAKRAGRNRAVAAE